MSQVDIALCHLLGYEVADGDDVFWELDQNNEFKLFFSQNSENLGIFDFVNLIVLEVELHFELGEYKLILHCVPNATSQEIKLNLKIRVQREEENQILIWAVLLLELLRSFTKTENFKVELQLFLGLILRQVANHELFVVWVGGRVRKDRVTDDLSLFGQFPVNYLLKFMLLQEFFSLGLGNNSVVFLEFGGQKEHVVHAIEHIDEDCLRSVVLVSLLVVI